MRLFAKALEEALEEMPGVRWARVNGWLGRVVVSHEEGRPALRELRALLEQVESDHHLEDRALRVDAVNPGDHETVQDIVLEIAGDLVSLAGGTLRPLRRHLRLPWDVNLSAAVTVVEGIPRVRAHLEELLSYRATDLALELTKSSLQLALGSGAGPAAGFLGHYLRLRAARERRRVWEEREAELCGSPGDHQVASRSVSPRPSPLRPGLVERYERRSIPVALGAFGAGLLWTRCITASSPALFAGLPRAARQGRSAFVLHLAHVLAKRGVLVLDETPLDHLDRLDAVVVPADVLSEQNRSTTAFVQAARRAGLQLVLAVGDEDPAEWLPGCERLSGGPDLPDAIRALQRRGLGVALVASGSTPAWLAADVGIALESQPPPWGAHVLCRWGLDDARLLLEAVPAARRTAQEGVWITMGEAGLGLGLTFAGLRRRTTRRVMTTAHTAAMLAMANGIRRAHGLERPVEAPEERAVPWHTMEPGEVLAALHARPEGLSSDEVRARRRPTPPPPSRLESFGHMVGRELRNPMTPVLGAGAAASYLIGSVADAGLLAGAVALNGVVGGFQRYRTEQTLAAMRSRENRPVRVLRDGGEVRVPDDELVPGDVVELEAGDAVPADCRILDATTLEADESTLTGEPFPVAKQGRAVGEAPVAERASMLYEGTSIAAGAVRAVVVGVGEATEAGRAVAYGRDREARAGGVEARLEALSRWTMPIAGASAAAMTVSGLLRGRPARRVITDAVGLGVASVPEGLPLLATMAQLAAARRLSEKGTLVRNPRSIEPLGRVDVLCADKTGTLTEGRIRLAVLSDGVHASAPSDAGPRHRRVLAVALRATPQRNGGPLPHPTDEALVSAADALGLTREEGLCGFRRLAALPFEPARGFHACLDGHARGGALSVKGAPEVVLPRCAHGRDGEPLDDEGREGLVRAGAALARRGYRVLAVAERSASTDEKLVDGSVAQLRFCGFIGYADPVRPSARQAIADLRAAGVHVLMITGDHPSTAGAIASELGFADSHGVMTGAELESLDDARLMEALPGISVFARVTPVQKVRIVRALRRAGRTVAMTGDGANDAPAIHLADVGIALGERSTAAARNAADLIVADGRIETIVHAVLEGRALWSSVRDAISILVGGNLGEIAFNVLGGLLSGSSPLNARQLLLVNLVTDTLPALVIAVRPPGHEQAADLLSEGPEASLGAPLRRDILWRAVLTSSAAGTAWATARMFGGNGARASTVALLALTGSQLGQTLVAGRRSGGVWLASLGSVGALLAIVQTPGLSHFFGCRPLGPLGLAQAAGATTAATAAAALIPPLVRTRERVSASHRREGAVDREPGDRIVEPDVEAFGDLDFLRAA